RRAAPAAGGAAWRAPHDHRARCARRLTCADLPPSRIAAARAPRLRPRAPPPSLPQRRRAAGPLAASLRQLGVAGQRGCAIGLFDPDRSRLELGGARLPIPGLEREPAWLHLPGGGPGQRGRAPPGPPRRGAGVFPPPPAATTPALFRPRRIRAAAHPPVTGSAFPAGGSA